jgi:hypothetical protein
MIKIIAAKVGAKYVTFWTFWSATR